MRLIDADALRKKFDKRYDDAFMQMHTRDEREHWNGVCAGVNWGRNAMTDAPTIDAVEVVRCKDCEYKRELEGHLVCGDSMRAEMGVDVFEIPTYYFDKTTPDDFCSRGRKKNA